jgi:hypothetical protein
MAKLTLNFNTKIIPQENGGFIKMFELEDFYGVDPVIWLKETFIQYERFAQSTFSKGNMQITDAEEDKWETHFSDFQKEYIPPAFVKLFDCVKKKEQEDLLRNEKISSSQLANLICYAGMRFGYKLSKYSAFHYPNIHQDKTWPKVFHVREDGTVDKAGFTDLTDAQLIQIIRQRKLVFARILELNDSWHCFYYNDKSLAGKENYGETHMHYISNLWTIPKETIIHELGNRDYKFNGLHIAYVTHRNKETI